jgi:CRISPR-associated endonuclease/helicase Cas3
VTVLLCTATQPALEGEIGSGKSVFTGIPEATEIIDDPRSLAQAFRRVDLSLPDPDSLGRLSWDSLATELVAHDQVLCIVNTRRDCRELHALMPEGTVHLSGFMCAEERSELVSEVKEKLRKGKPVRVVSTQLVEAGVDIDFPVVYRALGGLDSIAQAAGRCNREGTLEAIGKKGQVVVFLPPRPAPPGLLRKGEEASMEILRQERFSDIGPERFKEYFRIFYGKVIDFDQPRFEDRLVKEAREFKFQFRTLAYHFNLIDNSRQESIIVEYDGARQGSTDLIKELRYKGPSRNLLRKLQRFTVSVPRYRCQELFRKGMIEEVSGFYVQVSPALYRKGLGLLPDESQWSEEVLLV